MNYALLSHKITGYKLRSNDKVPTYNFYKYVETEPATWSNLIGLYSTIHEAILEFEREASKNERKWIHLIYLETREIIRSLVIYDCDFVVGRL